MCAQRVLASELEPARRRSVLQDLRQEQLRPFAVRLAEEVGSGRVLDDLAHADVSVDELKIAAENYSALADLLLGFHPEWQTPAVCEAGCLEEILALPSAANSKEQPPKQK